MFVSYSVTSLSVWKGALIRRMARLHLLWKPFWMLVGKTTDSVQMHTNINIVTKKLINVNTLFTDFCIVAQIDRNAAGRSSPEASFNRSLACLD